VYSVANAEEEIKMFVNSPDAQLVPIEGGAHFLNCSHVAEVNQAVLDFISQYK
jgi:pimeloyl-ACP methyl ester carboxylesterase